MFSLDFSSRTPIYEQLYNNTIRLITAEVLKPGDQLHTVRQLAMELGINPNTVSKAYQMLERDGYIHTGIGRGSFISSDLNVIKQQKKEAVKHIENALSDAMNNGLTCLEIQSIIKSFCDNLKEIPSDSSPEKPSFKVHKTIERGNE